MAKRVGWILCLAIVCAPAVGLAQGRRGGGPPAPATPDARGEDGIPVESELVRARCGSCHRADEKNVMTRISFRRATPENWEKTIKRMVTLNKVNLEPADARVILKYLADHQGLAPE